MRNLTQSHKARRRTILRMNRGDDGDVPDLRSDFQNRFLGGIVVSSTNVMNKAVDRITWSWCSFSEKTSRRLPPVLLGPLLHSLCFLRMAIKI